MSDKKILTYSQLLKDYIKESGLTLEEISKRCETLGVIVHPTYISKLRLGKRAAPSDEITVALATVLNGDESRLKTFALIEKLPEESRKQMAEASYYIDSVDDAINKAFIQQILFSQKEDADFDFAKRVINAFAIKHSITVETQDLLDPVSIKKSILSKLLIQEKADLLSLLVNISSGPHMGDIPDVDGPEFEVWFNDENAYNDILARREAYVAEIEKKFLIETTDNDIHLANEFMDKFLERTSKLPDEEKELVTNMIELILKKYGL